MKIPTYYSDYDSDSGVKLLSTDAKIDYLEKRINKILISPIQAFFSFRKPDSPIWDLNMGICALICEGITGLSTYADKGTDYERIKSFFEKFMYPHDSGKSTYTELIWQDVRCQLSHGFHIRKARIETDPTKHFTLDSKHRLIIDLESFFDDFKKGCHLYFSTLKQTSSQKLRYFFEERFNDIFSDLV